MSERGGVVQKRGQAHNQNGLVMNEVRMGEFSCMGRSRGGLTTKIHALVDGHGRPIALELTEGQAHDGMRSEDMLGALLPDCILWADRGYDSDELRARMAERAPTPTSGRSIIAPIRPRAAQPRRTLLQ